MQQSVLTGGGGVLTIGPTTYSVSSIGAVQVQTDLEPRELAGWLCLTVAIICVMAAMAAVGLLAMSTSPDARGTEKRDAGIALAISAGLSPSFWGAWALRRRTRYHVAIFVSGQPHLFSVPNEAAAFQLREQIVAAMTAGGGNVYVDNRQVHVHNPPPQLKR